MITILFDAIILSKAKVILSFQKSDSKLSIFESYSIEIRKYDAINIKMRHTVCRFLQH